MPPSPLTDAALYNSRIINSFLLLIKQRYSYVNISELLDYAGMKEYEVADSGHWFTQDQVDRFYEKLVQLTGNPRIAREAGRHAASPDVMGAMRQYVLGLVDAPSTFEIISKATANFTRSTHYQSRRLSANSVEITVTPVQPGLEKPYQCENRIGFFEAVLLVFNHKVSDLQYFPEMSRLPTVQHPECMFQGGEVCRYIVTWERGVYLLLKRMRNLALLLLAGFGATLLLLRRFDLLAVWLPLLLCAFLILALASERSEKRALRESLVNTRDSIENLLDQIEVNYNNAMLSNELGRRLGSHTRLAELLPDVASILRRRLDFDRGLILLPDRDQNRLEVAGSYGYSEEELRCVRGLPLGLDEEAGRDLYLDCFRDKRPFLVNDLEASSSELGSRSLACARTIGTKAFICCPVLYEEESLGVLAVEHVSLKKRLVERDMSLMMGVASVLGIGMRNCELIGALEEAKEELEARVARRTEDLERSRRTLEQQHGELERTYHQLEVETAQRVQALEELREKERLLLQQSRLAALGEMISNIAHQWRQPLNELGLIVQELPMMYDQGNFSREYLKGSVAKFMKVLAHTSKTIDDFRNFFKPDKEMVTFGVKRVVEQTLSLIEESFKHLQIAITVAGDDAAQIHGHPNEFSQAILNILFNSRDAFQERDVKSERVIEIEISRQAEKAVLTVTDNAGGIPEEIMDRIFDPYFTTRGPERGTGIGLYMTKIIVEKNIPGRLTVRNTGTGAQFRIEV